jgi:hypothetical protein
MPPLDAVVLFLTGAGSLSATASRSVSGIFPIIIAMKAIYKQFFRRICETCKILPLRKQKEAVGPEAPGFP